MKYNAYFDKSTKALAGAASAIALCAAPAALAQGLASSASEEIRAFNIEAQPLSRAIAEFSRQSDINVVAPSRTTTGLRSQALKGEMTPQEALKVIIGDAALAPQMQPNGSIVLAENDQSAEFRDRSLIRVAQVLSGAPSEREDEDEEVPALAADTVIVTGTNIRGVENPTVPVLQFDREDIDLSGAATLDDFLRTIPQNFASETQLSADSANPNNLGDRGQFTQGTTVDLRGLGAGSTLTLLNGRRMAAAGLTSAVDINVLPLGVIERVDVLTDGATAVYGSDAVGGVINFITRRDYEGFDINARYGTVTDGSMEDFAVGGAGGLSWGSGGVFAGVDYQETKPLLVEERDYIDLGFTREGATLGSDSDRFSVAGGVNQEIGSKARFGADVLYSDRNSESFAITTINPVTSTSEQSALFINSRFEYDITDAITASVYMDYGRNKVASTQLELGSTTPAFNEFENQLYVYEGKISGQLLDLPGGALSFSLGGLYREERFERGGTVVAQENIGRRDVYAGYAEVLAPIIGKQNALPFMQKLELSLAGRYEDYSDAGDSLDPKIGIYWEVNDELSLRASYSQAFRAPDLNSLNELLVFGLVPFPAAAFTAVTAPTPGPFGVNTLFINAGGFELSPESATSWSGGFSYNPGFIDDLSVTGNYFTISYSDRLEFVNVTDPIQDTAFVSLLDLPPNLSQIENIFNLADADLATLINPFNLTPEDVQVFIRGGLQNIAERDVSGFDLGLNYSKDTDLGRFSASANATYMIDYIARLSEASPSTEQVDVLYRPLDFKLRANVSWSKNGFTVFTAVNYADGYRDRIDTASANSIDAWTTIDLSLAYNTGDPFGNPLLDSTRIGFSVTNLFDNDPPFVTTIDGLNFDPANADPFGRRISFTISKAF